MSTVPNERLGYVNLPQRNISCPKATVYNTQGGPLAVVDLGGVTIHITGPQDARQLAAVFTRAAELLDVAQAEAQDGAR